MKSLVTMAVIMAITTGFAQTHDLTVTDIVEPSDRWIQDSVEVIPKVEVTNLGSENEYNVPVTLFVFDTWVGGDTVYAESATIPYIGAAGSASESIEVTYPTWLPTGICEDWQEISYPDLPGLEEVGMHYLIQALVDLETDENQNNDTLYDQTIALLSQDVGVIDLQNLEGRHLWGNFIPYPAGTEFTWVATVENYGIWEKHDIPVDLEIFDVTADPDILVWHNIQLIEYVDWRGNENENPYRAEVEFPTFTTPEEHRYRFECRTELEGEECPENDEVVRRMSAVEEYNDIYSFTINMDEFEFGNVNCAVYFSLSHSTHVNLKVYDINGRFVKTLVSGYLQKGTYRETWSGRDEQGKSLASGIYLILMQAEGFKDARKVIVIN